jgi:CAAX protease family protein
VLFFDRYAAALNGASSLAILVNAALFASMHAVLFAYRSMPFHWEAVAISFIGGLLFAYRFTRTRSFRAVVLEHAPFIAI